MNWETVVRRDVVWDELEALQVALVREVQNDKSKAYLLISEPKPTFTHGRNSDPKDLRWTEAQIRQHQVKVTCVSRGGKWTFHGPGQILIYPIIHLPSWGYSSKSVRAFLNDFRKAVVKAIENLESLPVREGEPFGIYINEKKLASFGLAFEKSVSSHGMALYLTNQSPFFEGINPCGVSTGVSTCLNENLSEPRSWDSVAYLVAASIKNHFSFRLSQVL